MEAKARPFERVKFGFTGVESAHARFHTDPTVRVPTVATWRVNLTALSQRLNLYFIATLDKIQVYRPSFPYQTLGRQPCLTIVPQLANQSAEGYIDEQNPHAINHLIVGDLGNQEILLFSTDSGNVVAYHTSAIDAVIERDAYKFSVNGNADFVGLRPFFSEWVDESAWGLAIHREGRMIAVSANTPFHTANDDQNAKITVFAFALTVSGGDSGEDDSNSGGELGLLNESAEWKTWSGSTAGRMDTTSDTPQRDCNYKITLAGVDGHRNNVPCVSFVNGPDDASGVWLLSTDTENQIKMWQIWKGKCFKTWRLSSRNNTAIPWTRPEDVGWFVAALDIDMFRSIETMDEFIGHYRAPQYYGYHSSGDSYDLTNTVQTFTPQNNSIHPIEGQVEADTSEEEDDVLLSDMDSSDGEIANVRSHSFSATISESAVITDPAGRGSDAVNTRLIQQRDGEIPASAVGSDAGHRSNNNRNRNLTEQQLNDIIELESTGELSTDDDDENEDVDEEFVDYNDNDDDDASRNSSRSATSSTSYNPTQSDEGETLQNGYASLTTQALTALQTLSRKTTSKVKSSTTHKATSQIGQIQVPQIPIIHCSTSHVRLYKDPTADYPHVFCARMLWQKLPLGLDTPRIASLRRLSMVQQIPELGIIIIASQLGRCAVCSLTKRASDGLIGFRVDWILPTKRQERARARPASCPLLGIATSPVQGHVASPIDSSFEDNTAFVWTQGHMMDGTPTTFDANVVVLDSRAQNQTVSLPVAQKRLLQEPHQNETWRPYENSRRYRLMLTYTDQTVLTYEISRNVERKDIGS